MSKYLTFNSDGTILNRYDSLAHKNIPTEALMVTDEIFERSANEHDGIWSLVDGEFFKLPFPPQTQDELNLIAAAEAKQTKNQALSTITVTTASGNVFDGNETARINMLSALQAAEFLNQTQAGWKLADNSVVMVTVAELKEALALAIQRVGEIVTA